MSGVLLVWTILVGLVVVITTVVNCAPSATPNPLLFASLASGPTLIDSKISQVGKSWSEASVPNRSQSASNKPERIISEGSTPTDGISDRNKSEGSISEASVLEAGPPEFSPLVVSSTHPSPVEGSPLEAGFLESSLSEVSSLEANPFLLPSTTDSSTHNIVSHGGTSLLWALVLAASANKTFPHSHYEDNFGQNSNLSRDPNIRGSPTPATPPATKTLLENTVDISTTKFPQTLPSQNTKSVPGDKLTTLQSVTSTETLYEIIASPSLPSYPTTLLQDAGGEGTLDKGSTSTLLLPARATTTTSLYAITTTLGHNLTTHYYSLPTPTDLPTSQYELPQQVSTTDGTGTLEVPLVSYQSVSPTKEIGQDTQEHMQSNKETERHHNNEKSASHHESKESETRHGNQESEDNRRGSPSHSQTSRPASTKAEPDRDENKEEINSGISGKNSTGSKHTVNGSGPEKDRNGTETKRSPAPTTGNGTHTKGTAPQTQEPATKPQNTGPKTQDPGPQTKGNGIKLQENGTKSKYSWTNSQEPGSQTQGLDSKQGLELQSQALGIKTKGKKPFIKGYGTEPQGPGDKAQGNELESSTQGYKDEMQGHEPEFQGFGSEAQGSESTTQRSKSEFQRFGSQTPESEFKSEGPKFITEQPNTDLNETESSINTPRPDTNSHESNPEESGSEREDTQSNPEGFAPIKPEKHESEKKTSNPISEDDSRIKGTSTNTEYDTTTVITDSELTIGLPEVEVKVKDKTKLQHSHLETTKVDMTADEAEENVRHHSKTSSNLVQLKAQHLDEEMKPELQTGKREPEVSYNNSETDPQGDPKQKHDSEPEPKDKLNPKSEAESEPEPENVPELEPPANKIQLKNVNTLRPELELEPVGEPEPEPENIPVPESNPEPQSKTDQELHTTPEPELQSEPKPVNQQSETEPMPQGEPEPWPAKDPGPEPQTRPEDTHNESKPDTLLLDQNTAIIHQGTKHNPGGDTEEDTQGQETKHEHTTPQHTSQVVEVVDESESGTIKLNGNVGVQEDNEGADTIQSTDSKVTESTDIPEDNKSQSSDSIYVTGDSEVLITFQNVSKQPTIISNCSNNTSVTPDGNGCNEGEQQQTNPHGGIQWSFSRALLFIFQLVIMVETVLGNLMVILAVKMEKKLQTPFNYFIVNLAFTDMNVGLSVMSFFMVYNLYDYFPFSSFFCDYWIWSDYTMTFESVMTLAAISVDRLWSVTWSLHYRNHNSGQKSAMIIVATWCIVALVWLPPFIYDRVVNSYSDGDCFWDPVLNKKLVLYAGLLGYYTPLFVMLGAYARILWVVRKRASSIRDAGRRTSNQGDPPSDTGGGEGGGGREKRTSTTNTTAAVLVAKDDKQEAKLKREMKAVYTLLNIVVIFLICWVPFYILFVSVCLFQLSAWFPTLFPSWYVTFSYWMAYINSALNPVLYPISSLEFRHAYKKVLKSAIGRR
ncbi:hypothetical protein Pcinc_033122 [Petrolisthes cinctipes]|uniref:G-protein coupled receptors family 1 profile domain-containing protein n=1 Tax=Petrolisthes cinctipes TaxID=88211 RepID=A0AAE1ESS2_PETCI|nr:hypothetical protein Pcinc_033122 [Petrolisthes cinctipes]